MNLIKSIFLVVFFPRQGWEMVEDERVRARVVQAGVFYPMLAVLAITAFAAMFYHIDATLPVCIKQAIIDFVKYFATYWVASYVLTGFFPGVVKTTDDANRVNVVILYALIVLVALNIIDNLLPTPFSYLQILSFYVFFLFWKAAGYLGIGEGESTSMLLVGGALVFALPLAIDYGLGIALIK